MTELQVVTVAPVVDRTQMMRLFQAGYDESARAQMDVAWLDARERWLRRYRSEKTRRAYADAWLRWMGFLNGRPLWQATSADVEEWSWQMQQPTLEGGQALSNATVNLRLAAVSSFYSFVIRDSRMGNDGIERTLFFDASGRTRQNPFRSGNVERLPRKTLTNVDPVSREELKRMMDACNVSCRTGARDKGLLTCYLYTGRRLSEIARLRWGDIEPGDEKGDYVFQWHGKGGKEGRRAFSRAAYDAIVAWLKADGRWTPGKMDREMYIFRPLTDHGTGNLNRGATATELVTNRPISTGQINGIIKKIAKRAGLDPAQMHTHRIRHSFAFYLYEATKDLMLVMESLDHSSPEVTKLYLQSMKVRMEKPQDRTTTPLQQALGF